jgi:hypothetical protein
VGGGKKTFEANKISDEEKLLEICRKANLIVHNCRKSPANPAPSDPKVRSGMWRARE